MPDWLRPLSYELTFMVYARRPITTREISRLVNDVACWSCDGFSSAHIAAAAAALAAAAGPAVARFAHACVCSTSSIRGVHLVRTYLRTDGDLHRILNETDPIAEISLSQMMSATCRFRMLPGLARLCRCTTQPACCGASERHQ